MYFTISASGSTKEEAVQSLEGNRDPGPEHASLKNQLIEHIAAHLDSLSADATGISVSASFSLSYSKGS